MTPIEDELLRILGLDFLREIEALSIFIFFYGVPSSPVVYDLSTSLITGVFVVLFAASVVIFMFVLSFLQSRLFLIKT